jgi:hypothetical protein
VLAPEGIGNGPFGNTRSGKTAKNIYWWGPTREEGGHGVAPAEARRSKRLACAEEIVRPVKLSAHQNTME